MIKHLLAACAAVVSLALAPMPATAQDQPRRGGTLTYAISAETPTYDCHASDTFATLHFASPFYSTLLKFDLARYPEVQGDLAESWTVSPDGLNYTFRLHRNVRFHDGTMLTSADVKATYDRLRNPPEGVVSTRKATFEDIAEITTPDPQTVVFRLSARNPSMLMHFASPWNCVYSAARLAQDSNWPAQNIMGTGAFRFTEHVRGSHVAGARFDGYFREGRPYLDGFRGVFFAQSAAMVNAFQGGQVQAEFRTVSTADRDRLTQAMGNRVRIEESPWVLNLVVVFNTQKAPFNDIRVRRALHMAIDRRGGSQGLARASALRHVGGLMRPGSPFALPDAELAQLPGFGSDIRAARDQARRLLQEAGVPNLSFVLTNRTIAQPYTPAGVFLVDQWRQIGVTAEHRQLETSPYLAALNAGNYDVAVDFSNLFMDEPSLVLAKYVSHDRAPENRSRAVDRELDTLFERQLRAGSDQERMQIRAFERRALDQAYQVPLLWWHRIVPTHAAVRGWRMSPSHNLGQDLVDVWIAQ
jgi:peptide/nickel transport system substrate-binding protein